MASPSSSTNSPPSSPPASLLIETIDPRDTIAQSGEQQSGDTRPASPSSSGSSNRTITQRDLTLPFSPSASSDRTITRGDLAGPANQGSQPPQNPRTIPAITDPITFPSAARPAFDNLDSLARQYQYGITDFPHIHLQIGRDLRATTNTMDPPPPARVVQRNDCKSISSLLTLSSPIHRVVECSRTHHLRVRSRVVNRRPVNWPIPNADPNDKKLATKGRTTCLGPRVVTYNNIEEGTSETKETSATPAAAAAATPAAAPASAPAKVPGISGTEGLAGLGEELEALVLAKGEYNDKFGVFRERWTKVQTELAAKAKEVEGTRFTTAAELLPFVGAVGVMFALGKAVDLAAFPGKDVGEFDEVCAITFIPFRVQDSLHVWNGALALIPTPAPSALR